MTQTWTGRSQNWLVPLVVAAGVLSMVVTLWAGFVYLSASSFNAGRASVGLATARAIAVAICLLFAFLLVQIVRANAPNTLTLDDDQVTVSHGPQTHTMKLKDIDAVLYVKTSVQSGAGLFFYPREEYLAATGSRVQYGKADPALTVSLQRFTDADERAAVLAVREKIKAAGGRFGTSVGQAEPDDDDRNVTRTPAGRLRVARPVIRRGDQ